MGLRIGTASGPSGGPSGRVRASSSPARTNRSRIRARARSSGASGTVPGGRRAARREGVVPLQAGHFLDQVDFTRHIRTPARDLYGEPLVLRRDEEPYRGEQPLDLGALDVHAKQPADALGAQKDGALLLGRGPEVDRRLRAPHLPPRR